MRRANAKDECKEYLTPTHKTSSKPWIWRVWSIIIIGHHRLSFVISIHFPFVQKILCTMSDAGILASKTSSDRQEHKTSWVTLWPNDLDLEPSLTYDPWPCPKWPLTSTNLTPNHECRTCVRSYPKLCFLTWWPWSLTLIIVQWILVQRHTTDDYLINLRPQNFLIFHIYAANITLRSVW